MKKKTNILFVIPPYLAVEEIKTSEPESWMTSVTVPLGAVSLAAYVAKYAKCEFYILDLNVSFAKQHKEFAEMPWNDFLLKEFESLLKENA